MFEIPDIRPLKVFEQIDALNTFELVVSTCTVVEERRSSDS